MSFTKTKIVEAITEVNGFNLKRTNETVGILLQLIKTTLASGDDVLISSFGEFYVKKKRERRGRNPAIHLTHSRFLSCQQ